MSGLPPRTPHPGAGVMTDDTRADELAEIAAQLAGRVRDDDPNATSRWLDAVVPGACDRRDLLFILAAAVPIDVPFTHLTAWARLDAEVIAHRREVLDKALRPARRAA